MSRTESYRRWTYEEVAFLKEHYDTLTAEAIADALNRTPDSIWEKANKESLRKHGTRHKRDAEGPWYCPDCGKTKPATDFSISKSGKSSAYCKSCFNKNAKERRKRNA